MTFHKRKKPEFFAAVKLDVHNMYVQRGAVAATSVSFLNSVLCYQVHITYITGSGS